MNKSNYFFGQSVFGQLISLIDEALVSRTARELDSDYRIKRFSTSDHLISMLFASVSHCNSLREVSSAMLGLKGKTKHFRLKAIPYRSTLSDANKRRSHSVFGKIYSALYKSYKNCLSDSLLDFSWQNRVEIIDSTTIALFRDILKCVGRKSFNGKTKGGIKVHTQMNLQERVPKLVWYSSAATHDKNFLNHINLEKGQIAVFDKGYNDYKTFETFTKNEVFFVTRMKTNATYKSVEELEIPSYIDQGVIKDEIICIELSESNQLKDHLKLRRIAYWEEENKRVFEFITNLFGMNAGHIALIYKQRWQIELLYKQFKQNFPLKYFLGDNENAIMIQIWSALITNLLLTVLRKKLKRKWAFSNLVSFCRLHLFNYINLIKFLNNPEKDWIKTQKTQIDLFTPG
ncbi:MAG: IS4 family transposase [Bacteroidota bacterium]